MANLSSILKHNQSFVEEKKYEFYETTKFPEKKLVILTCMDTRLLELLHHAMGLKNGDAKIIKNAGAVVSHPFGSVMRSILVAVYELQAEEVCIIGHHECGMASLEVSSILEKAKQRGVKHDCLELLTNAGIDLDSWMTGFESVEDSVTHSVKMVRSHPLMPEDVPVHGLVIDSKTGRLDVVADGYSGMNVSLSENKG
ncbi:carbonic anhydrase [Bacillus sonorensis]|uniref:carbonic anhydrase n=2 Tax=Bacillus sonorensis TaxID=119858 RepID=M5NZH0_9BACI|nr:MULTISPECIES: carbonic anhydrase [Bacillus]TWK79556.1 Beta-carbonic anhydrase 1 [Bacillus paralicheniformis]ASB87243.1 Carbonate dehydratase [Bacillus sonorensis]EME73276.1 carbonic anhydrase YvdA [Bacillus sonorensis L12]MBG9914265.1 carbonic anhydrase [Bacillus sonorensis]MCF7616490.1 carbonic anhydrase [Bacillus sonorensis]